MGLLDAFKGNQYKKEVEKLQNKLNRIKSTFTPVIEHYNLPDVVKNAITYQNPYNGKYRENGIKNAVHLLYCDFSTSYKWIQDATNPKIYFENYIKALQLIMELEKYSTKYKFHTPTPTQQLIELKINYITYTNSFINRYWTNTINSVQKLKTDKGKQNRLNKFFNSLLNEYCTFLTQDNINYVNSLKNTPIDTPITIIKQKVNCGKYNVDSIDNIKSISNDPLAVRLLQKAATSHKRNGDIELAVECLKKSNSISDTLSKSTEKLLPNEYLRVLKYMELLNKPDLVKLEEQKIKLLHPEFWDKRISNRIIIDESIKNCLYHNNDLIFIISNNNCPICKQFNQKVFSISGKSLKYPKLPNEIVNQTHNCLEHSMSANAYYEGITNLNK